MASVREIARSAGVSVATVSRALNNFPEVSQKTRSRVLAAARRAGYSLDSARKTADVIGLAYPGQPVNAEFGAFDAAIFSGAARGVNEQKFDVALVSIQRDKRSDESYTQFFRRKGVRGVVLRSFADTRNVCETIAEEGFPHIVVADRFDNPKVNYVYCDSLPDSRAAVEHLIHLGHQRIALCIHMVADSDHNDRRRAYHETLAAHGLPSDAALVAEVIADMNGGASAISRLLSLPDPPTAVFFTDPLATLGALRRALELDLRIPEELSIVGFDDAEVRKMSHPTFSAVCQDAQALGFSAAQWLTRRLSGTAEESYRVCNSTYFELNHTTGAPPAAPVRVLPDGRRVQARAS